MVQSSHPAPADHQPLISNRFVLILTGLVVLLAMASALITFGGHRLGERLALAGHTTSTTLYTITIGQDRLQLAANTLRFESQRHNGTSDRADLYLSWPQMTGYSLDGRRRFDDITLSATLIFAQLSQSTMSRDMSGRLEPIYSHLFSSLPEKGPYGLTMHRLKPESGYQNEVLYTASRPGQPDYAVRCLLPTENTAASSGDCQRDVHVGRDLSLLYRFSRDLLADWQRLDTAMENYVAERLVNGSANPEQFNKNLPTVKTNPSS